MFAVSRSTRHGAALALAIFLASGAAAPVLAQAEAASPASAEVAVAVGKSQVIELPAPYTDVMIANSDTADVLPLTNRSIYVVGKQIGSTALSVYGPGKQLISAANVVVSADIEGLKTRLNEILPEEHDIAVRPANQSIVLSGSVSSPANLHKVLALAESYAPTKVVNMLGVEGTQQIMLSVRFVEMQRTVAKNLRLNVNRSLSGDQPQVSVFTGDTNLGNVTSANTFGLVSALYNGNLEILLDALETKGLVKTLAEPNLVAMSGDTASFLAGGEFPIPVAQSNTNGQTPTITIEYKQFGVSLAFTPTLLKDGLMNIVAKPEVSSIDPTVSVDLGTIKVPGIKVRRANTTVELRDGESFTVAGLLKEDYQSEVRQLPWVGDMPVLGALFKSNGYQRDETELVIVVTPHLVTPRRGPVALPGETFTPPSDLELFLLGAQQGPAPKLRPEDRALLSSEPGKGGIEGPHGHVLF
ncbi:type II and III secretion system protein family protein [Phenylobacterium sp.]|uniref:type II and III secretion system protein family protein n=1 Tax=Phenylobacterium sp. TaxID=1871053 RepID=UPI0035B0E71F